MFILRWSSSGVVSQGLYGLHSLPVLHLFVFQAFLRLMVENSGPLGIVPHLSTWR